MIFILIMSAIAVYHFVPKLMTHVHQRKEKYAALSLQGVTLSVVSVLLSAGFITFFILLPLSFFDPEFAVKHSLSFFYIFLAFMIGAEVTTENPPDFSHHAKAAIFLILLGMVFWPATYFAGRLLDTTFTSVVLFNEAGLVEYSAWMIGVSVACPTIIELTERYI